MFDPGGGRRASAGQPTAAYYARQFHFAFEVELLENRLAQPDYKAALTKCRRAS